ncbi:MULTISPECIES: ABC transporter substrate-binding protein [unclassified Parafrankia]|uniref:ABC transporter substrate-binding protein n=1 Tax=unclassified Parafrankia TaxID=2994368 RepID=UPI000DA54C86|nr:MULTISPECIES: ABC transporter substrate-binding protein [unclassified Parafrankia]TCJ34910.1 amino acid-binding protein [Parafrankia sp. BMG5.11]CAI7975949.1 Amino acid-binding protein [Frankia sp. Hr75.2]SQE00363.1 conserved exported hypothetical protein [Parafrankia sp. Ea1.12]
MAATILVVAATSCSAGGGGSSASSACGAPGVTPDQVEIGFLVSDSGAGSAAYASARAGIDARIGLANDEGGIHGRLITYDWRDDQNSPSQNAHVTDDLLRSKPVFGLVAATSAISGSLENLSQQGIPVVGLGRTDWAKYQNFFSYQYEPSRETIGRYIQSGGGSKVAFVTSGATTFTLDILARYKASFEALGLATTEPISYSRSTDSPAAVAQKLAATGANALVGFTAPQDLAAIMQAVRAAQLSFATSVSLTGYDRTILPTLGQSLAGVSFTVYFRPFEAGGPAIERYRSAMTRFAPQTTIPEQQFAMYAYIYTDLFLRGLELAGDCPTREGFISALRGVTDYDAGGLIQPVDIGNNASQPLDCYAFVQMNPAGNAFQVVREHLCADGTGT